MPQSFYSLKNNAGDYSEADEANSVGWSGLIDTSKAVADVGSDLLGLKPPPMRSAASDKSTDIEGDPRSNLQWIPYAVDMTNNATMFSRGAQAKILRKAGSMRPAARALLQSSYGMKSPMANMGAGVGVGVASFVGHEMAEGMREDSQNLRGPIEDARYFGRYDISDRIIDLYDRGMSGADQIQTLSHGAGTGSAAGGYGVAAGLIGATGINAYRQAVGGTRKDMSKDDGFYANWKKGLDERILRAFESGPPSDDASQEEKEAFDGYLDAYMEQARRVARGEAALSTVDPRIQAIVEKNFPAEIGSIYKDAASNKERVKTESDFLAKLEAQFPQRSGPKSMSRKTPSKQNNKPSQSPTKGFGNY